MYYQIFPGIFIEYVWNCLFCVIRGHRQKFLNCDAFLPQIFVFIFVNCADPHEMPHYAAFHLGLHGLPVSCQMHQAAGPFFISVQLID